ncbi:type IV toxin-antitoxin system AbiEi family antitoxin [Gordonia hydrophobica]|uniref:Type IV toxin-antitoxin system AbiEi family antitoxin n=1 Tax=Gordonia hydrophobica TaxID=40516 RepID=A0ABZ2TZ27_9ACTN|nr:type IV toxin-antitoxin system AbiEi family antitoxin [Gordonia hydrophobica]MBM7365984.1 hypothetical protein [Gordonia hydrophobica]
MWIKDEHGLIWRSRNLDAGITERRLRAALRAGDLVAVGRGVAAESAMLGDAPWKRTAERYRLACLAAAIAIGHDDPKVLSHESAAAILGLALLKPDRSRIHLTNGRSSGGVIRPNRVIHHGVLPDADVVEVDGVRITSPARTAADLALRLPDFARTLTVLDSALRMGVDRRDLEERLACQKRNVVAARHALRLANGLSANPGESWGRAQMITENLPVPTLQSEYHLRGGRLAIADYDWDGTLIGEFDGFIKYQRETRRSGQTVEEAVIEEKRREDALRDLGLDVVRWIWADLEDNRMIPLLVSKLKRNRIVVA